MSERLHKRRDVGVSVREVMLVSRPEVQGTRGDAHNGTAPTRLA
jgi:hypothetical protein